MSMLNLESQAPAPGSSGKWKFAALAAGIIIVLALLFYPGKGRVSPPAEKQEASPASPPAASEVKKPETPAPAAKAKKTKVKKKAANKLSKRHKSKK